MEQYDLGISAMEYILRIVGEMCDLKPEWTTHTTYSFRLLIS